jgi:DNA-binding LytR/AlgR family response regulator
MDKKIVIVDDDLELTKNIRNFLDKEGFLTKTVILEEKSRTLPFIFLTKAEEKNNGNEKSLNMDDILLKQFDFDNLINLLKLRMEKSSLKNKNEIDEQNNNDKIYKLNDKIFIGKGSNIRFEVIKDLKFVSAESPYILLKFASGKSILRRDTLNNLEAKLPDNSFIRIHRATIINTNFIIKIEKDSKSSYIIRLKDESRIFRISKRYVSKIKNRFS